MFNLRPVSGGELLFYDQCSHHIETRQLICSANQLNGFYMMRILVVKRLKNNWKGKSDIPVKHSWPAGHGKQSSRVPLPPS